jgi:predicted transcriptional regulator
LSLISLKGKKKILDEDYEELDKKIKSLTEEIDSNKAKRQSLTQTFEKKYSRFIQEASWISEDYKDNELYYIDAESTLHKAS